MVSVIADGSSVLSAAEANFGGACRWREVGIFNFSQVKHVSIFGKSSERLEVISPLSASVVAK